MKQKLLARAGKHVLSGIVCSFIIAMLLGGVAHANETHAVIQPGNKTLKFKNTTNHPISDIRVKNQAVPSNGTYVVRITSKSPTQATVDANPATNIVADGATWNELNGLAGVEIVFAPDASLAVGDEARVIVENGPEGKDNRISLRLPLYPFQEPYRVYQTSVFSSYKNSDGGHYRSLLFFDLANLPSCATILSAEILLFPWSTIWYRYNNPPGAGLVLHRVLKSWNEGSADGINNAAINGVTGYERWFGDNQLTGGPEDWTAIGLGAGTDYDASTQSSTVLFTSMGPPESSVPNRFFGFEVTQFVQDWLDGTYENHGVLLKGNQIADDAIQFGVLYGGYNMHWQNSDVTYPWQNASTTQRPKLKVRYLEDTAPPAITLNGDNPMMIECPASYSEPGATVRDACDPSPSLTITGSVPSGVPGSYNITYTAKDASGNQSSAMRTVNVVDTTPPMLTVTLTPHVLWPPNHKMRDIHAAITVSDVCDANPSFVLKSIVSNEPEEGPGKKHSPDIMGHELGTPDTEFQLRAERLGGGNGRIYTVTYEVEDASGNRTTAQATVTVSHDMGKSVALAAELPLPESYALLPNYPNPFNPETEIRFQLPEANHVVIRIFNTLGKEIRTLVEGQYEAGYYRVRWDGKDDNGKSLASGVYLFQLRAGSFSQVKKMSLIR